MAVAENGPSTAFETAKRIDALGSSTSSRMFKMMLKGKLEHTGDYTSRGGKRYRLRSNCILNADSPSYPPEASEYWQCGCQSCVRYITKL